MPNTLTNEERRQKFKAYFLNLTNDWKIDKQLQKVILTIVLQRKNKQLEEYIEAFKQLVKYTDKKCNFNHYLDKRNKKPFGIKKGMFVQCVLEPDKKPGNYPIVMRLYFKYNKIIYDFQIGKDTSPNIIG